MYVNVRNSDTSIGAECSNNASCVPPLAGSEPYGDEELDFYACLNEFDNSVGTVLSALKRLGYYENTMICTCMFALPGSW